MTQKELVNFVVSKSVDKANKSFIKMIVLGFMAGVSIAFGAVGNIVVSAELSKTLPGIAKFFGAAVFPVGLMIIIMIGYELFTSNTMGISAVYNKDISFSKFMKNLFLSLLFNLLGCLFVAFVTVKTHTFNIDAKNMLNSIAMYKTSTSALDLILKGIMCNILVCASVLMAYSSKEVISKIFAAWFPIMLFVILGYDHIVANMFYLPAAYMLNTSISLQGILHNFVFTTIGNFIGGVVFIISPLYFINK